MATTDELAPEIIIGVDFGMTCTGVAYSMGPEWAEPKPIQHWPNKTISELANKVPTRLQYEQNSTIVKSWGFHCDIDGDEDISDILTCFKLHMDPSFPDPRPGAPSVEDARQWFMDYIRCIHDHIEETFNASFPDWKRQKTEFIFSVPTTWNNPPMIAEIERLIRAAGFGGDGPNHHACIRLTEAEAAAVYASKQRFNQSDVILVVDAGGGTTDVNVLKLASARGEPIRLQQLGWVEGRPIGSALIDMDFHRILSDRLEEIRDHLKEDPDIVADRMMKGRFERIKCAFGTAASSGVPTIPLTVPGLAPGFCHSGANIENSSLILTREDLKALFDDQIDSMLTLIDGQFDKMQKRHPGVQISYAVLSGGLGSSPYVRQRLKAYFESGAGLERSNAQDTKIVIAIEPQLAVVQGLVMDRVQAVNFKSPVFQERCCRLSYGVRCREEHNPVNVNHLGQAVTIDPRDNKKYVENQIDWFIKQVGVLFGVYSAHLLTIIDVKGEAVPTDGVSKLFWLKLKPGDEAKPWKTSIVVSNAPGEQLPTNLEQDGAEIICNVESVLQGQGIDMKVKNRHWYSLGEKYVRAKFHVKVILGAADLKFRLQSQNNVLSKDHDTIKVNWEVPMPTATRDGAGLTRSPRSRH